MDEPKVDFAQQVQEALGLPDQKKFYFNGFTVLVAAADVSIVLRHNDQPIAFLNSPHIVVKSLITALGALLADYEEKTGRKIPTLEELEKGASSAQPQK